jgi:hypothetical protein
MKPQMLPESGDVPQLTAYLLDRLPEEEARRIEERYFADDAFFVLAGACEQDLIRDYLLKKLSPDDTRSFERKYRASPGLWEKVEFCAAIMTLTGSVPASTHRAARIPSPVWRLAAAAAIVAGLVLIGWQQTRIGRLEAELHQVAIRDALKSGEAHPAVAVVAFALRPVLDRDANSSAVVLRIPADAGEVRLSLEIEPGNEAAEYRAALTLPGGGEVWSAFVLGGSRVLELTAPALTMVRGDYVLTLDARAGPAHQAYAFRVER